MTNGSPGQEKKPALPRQWIAPIRLLIYVVLAACSAYIYFNAQDLEITHLLIFLPVAAVGAMVLLDCRMSENYWQEQDRAQRKSSDG